MAMVTGGGFSLRAAVKQKKTSYYNKKMTEMKSAVHNYFFMAIKIT